MKIYTFTLVTFFSFYCSVALSADTKPYGLLTDLIEHTDYTWQKGYVSNVPVWQAENAIESLQYVEIGSTNPTFSWIVPGNAPATRQV